MVQIKEEDNKDVAVIGEEETSKGDDDLHFTFRVWY